MFADLIVAYEQGWNTNGRVGLQESSRNVGAAQQWLGTRALLKEYQPYFTDEECEKEQWQE